MSRHIWVCKGCLLKAGTNPDEVTQSLINRQGTKETCYFCGCIQDGSWFRHMQPCDLPFLLQKELGQYYCEDYDALLEYVHRTDRADPPHKHLTDIEES